MIISSAEGGLRFNGPAQLVDSILSDIETKAFRNREIIKYAIEIPLHRVDIVFRAEPLWSRSLDEIAGEAGGVEVRKLEILAGRNREGKEMEFQKIELGGPRAGCDKVESEIQVYRSLVPLSLCRS